MREILFRGKRKDNNHWTYGSLILDVDICRIHVYGTGESRDILQDTVGQYVDRKDEREIGVYEGDILQVKEKGKIYATIVRWNKCKSKFEGNPITPYGNWLENGIYLDADSFSMHKVIGNIHDNPELVNPAVKDSVNIDMLDPNTPQAAEGQETTQEQNAQESASQDQAMEVNAEEGGTEG